MLTAKITRMGKTAEELTWKVGNPAFTHIYSGIGLSAMADGAELAWIKKNFEGLRMSVNAEPVHWTGEDAAFILNNLNNQV